MLLNYIAFVKGKCYYNNAMEKITKEWDEFLKEEFLSQSYLSLRQFLKEEYSTKTVSPDKYDIFNKYRSESNLESTPILWKKDKFECLKTGYFWLSDTPEVESRGWDELYNCYRICVYAILKEKATGKTFNFMNTHFGFR